MRIITIFSRTELTEKEKHTIQDIKLVIILKNL